MPRRNRYVPPKSAGLKNKDPKQRGFLSKMLRFFIWATFVMMLCISLAAYGAYYFYRHISVGLPQITSLKDYHPPVVTTVYSDDNRKIAEFYTERRILRPLSDIPEMLINAFVAAEDSRFFIHQGVDIVSIIRAFFKNIEAGAIVQGGSTITQQVTKSFLLTPERSYERKLKEAILAYRIDKAFRKEEILYLYLNQIYLGHGAYGVEAAAQNYFGKSVNELDLAECAMLAGLPQAPSRYSPFHHFDKAKERQIYVLNRMTEEGYISRNQADEAIKEKLDIQPRKNWYLDQVPYYTEHVRQYVEEKYGTDALYNEGLQIYTAVNIEMQKAARKAIDKGLRSHSKRHGYNGPVKKLETEDIEACLKTLQQELKDENGDIEKIHKGMVVKGIVTAKKEKGGALIVDMGYETGILQKKDMRWARRSKDYPPAVGHVIWVKAKKQLHDTSADDAAEADEATTETEWDEEDPDAERQAQEEKDSDADILLADSSSINWQLELEQAPEAQSALVCIDLDTGHVKAMVGGRDFKESQFNRAIQSKRQPGSAFKPIIYAAALDSGKGYTPATEVIDNAIVYEGTRSYDQWKPKNYDRSFSGPILLRKALAKSRNTPTIQILSDIGIGYAIDYAKKLGISSDLGYNPSLALGTSGVSLLELVSAYSVFANMGERAEPVFITKILTREGEVLEEFVPRREAVIEESTAYIMTSLLQSVVREGTGRRVLALNRPAIAGKTGTTNDLRDAWFIGYTPGYISGVWVGYDIERSLGRKETGSKAASPIWLDFMKQILADKPERRFHMPKGVVTCKIDAETGLLPVPETKKVIYEYFKAGTAPKEYTKRPNSIAEADQFFKTDM